MMVACKLVDQNYKICTKDLLITTQWFLLKTHLTKMILKTTLKWPKLLVKTFKLLVTISLLQTQQESKKVLMKKLVMHYY